MRGVEECRGACMKDITVESNRLGGGATIEDLSMEI